MQLNVFYNGTLSNYEKDFQKEGRFIHGEIVSRFGFYTQKKASEKTRVLRIHGVGSSKDDGNTITNTLGALFGVRMRDDVQNIVKFVIEARKTQWSSKSKDADLKVNLMGWSRGGIGCIYAAHMISLVWDSLEAEEKTNIKLSIRIIAFDPVSGLGTNFSALDMSWTDTAFEAFHLALGIATKSSIIQNLATIVKNLEKWWELPAHVTEYHGFYAHDERSIGFATTMPTMTGELYGRVFKLYEVPGTHSTLVGNLYPNGGATPAKDGTPDPVGLDIYRHVVQKVAAILEEWDVQFDAAIHEEWLTPLGFKENLRLSKETKEQNPSPSLEDYVNYKRLAQKVSITWFKSINTPGLTDGRGVYLGDNKLDRKWMAESTLTTFLSEQNTKSFVDSVWQSFTGGKTKLEKLGGNVSVHDYKVEKGGW